MVYYAGHPTRAAAVPRSLLAGDRGSIQTDGYKGYDFLESLEEVDLAACWVWVRRLGEGGAQWVSSARWDLHRGAL